MADIDRDEKKDDNAGPDMADAFAYLDAVKVSHLLTD